MTYIVPNSTVEFFGDLGLADNYEDTLYFASLGAKNDYFTSLQKLASGVAMTYSRATRGRIRVEIPIRTLLGSNYMRFKNTSFEDFWFYAFVKNVEYINNVTTEVTFELDYIQTWMGVFELGQCYVERQHTESDRIGANIVSEGHDIGSYINEFITATEVGSTLDIQICALDSEEEGSGGGVQGGIYSPCHVFGFGTAPEADIKIKEYVDANMVDNIVSIYMCPSQFAGSNDTTPTIYDVFVDKPYASLNGFVPRNNKLFCYPYKFLEVDSFEGQKGEYLYEYFNTLPPTEEDGQCGFKLVGYGKAKFEEALIPVDYKMSHVNYTDVAHLPELSGCNFEEAIKMSHFPSCAFAIDSFKAYLAQSNANIPLTVSTSALNALVSGTGSVAMNTIQHRNTSVLSGSWGTIMNETISWMDTGTAQDLAGLSGLTSVGTTLAGIVLPNIVRAEQGTTGKGTEETDLMAASGQKRFTFYGKCITENYASMIDDYFTMFGYAVHNVRTPNMNARPNYTYVKTVGCQVHAKNVRPYGIPASHSGAIEKIFDSGIRFWKNHTSIGHYELPNAPSET